MRKILCRPEVRTDEIGCVDPPTDPVIDPMCCANLELAVRLSR
jgi:hypothetical protein